MRTSILLAEFSPQQGTTSNGDYILPFKKGAFLAGLPVQPTVLRYSSNWASPAWESIAGEFHKRQPVSALQSSPIEMVQYIQADAFATTGLRHARLLLCSPWHSVTIYVLPIYRPSEEEINDPELYAGNVRKYMIKYSQLQPSESVLEDKRQYHKIISRWTSRQVYKHWEKPVLKVFKAL